MRENPIIVFVILILTVSVSYSTDTNSVKYMPLQVGNYWMYNSNTWGYAGNTYWVDVVRVLDSAVYNNHIYYHMVCPTNSGLFNGYFRVDSMTGSLYKYDETNSCIYYHSEKLYDSLSANNGDSVKNCASDAYRCTGTSPYCIYGDSTYEITFYDCFQFLNTGYYNTKIYVRKYGFHTIASVTWGGAWYTGNGSTLKGCRVNGIVYGDTSLIPVRNINTRVSEYFYLYQNYPNPFNPVTKIKFEIPKSSSVKISIFDISGKELETLVNQNLKPGAYETSWNASNYSSGIYFCKIQAGEFTQTKKMVQLK